MAETRFNDYIDFDEATLVQTIASELSTIPSEYQVVLTIKTESGIACCKDLKCILTGTPMLTNKAPHFGLFIKSSREHEVYFAKTISGDVLFSRRIEGSIVDALRVLVMYLKLPRLFAEHMDGRPILKENANTCTVYKVYSWRDTFDPSPIVSGNGTLVPGIVLPALSQNAPDFPLYTLPFMSWKDDTGLSILCWDIKNQEWTQFTVNNGEPRRVRLSDKAVEDLIEETGIGKGRNL